MQAEMNYSQKPGSHCLSPSPPQPLTHFPEGLYGKRTRVIQVDFTGGLEIYETIEAGLKGLEVGVLGMSPSPLGEALLSAVPTPPPPAHPDPGTLSWSPFRANTSLCPRPVSLGLLE